MNENNLANVYLKAITKFLDTQDSTILSQEKIWELSTMLAKMAQPKKRYMDLYNSPESREERRKIK